MKNIIWSSETASDTSEREFYQKFQREALNDESYTVNDNEWLGAVYRRLDEARSILNRKIDGVIIAFGDLGLWNGRKQAYRIFENNIADILYTECDEAEWYGDGRDIRGWMKHHDGTNHVLFRIAKNKSEASAIGSRIYDGKIDEKGFQQMTDSLYPYIARIYGWDMQ